MWTGRLTVKFPCPHFCRFTALIPLWLPSVSPPYSLEAPTEGVFLLNSSPSLHEGCILQFGLGDLPELYMFSRLRHEYPWGNGRFRRQTLWYTIDCKQNPSQTPPSNTGSQISKIRAGKPTLQATAFLPLSSSRHSILS